MTDFATTEPSLGPLKARLASALHRYIARRLVVALLVSLCTGMTVHLAARAGVLFGLSLPDYLPATTAALAFCGALCIGVLRRPSMAQLAIAADKVLNGREVLRTVVEYSQGMPQNGFSTNLVREANALSDQIAPGRVVAPIGRWLLAATFLLGSAVIVVSLVWPSDRFASSPSSFTIEGASLDAIVAEIDEIALRMENDAVTSGDQYLMAVARTLSDVARESQSSASVDRDQLSKALSSIEPHAQAALGARAGGEAILERLTDLRLRVEAGGTIPSSSMSPIAERAEVPERADGDIAPASSENVPIEGSAAPSTAPASRQSQLSAQDMPVGPVEGPCQIDGEESCMGPADTNYSADRSMPAGEAARALGSTSQSDQDVAARDGLLIGAASQSGRGDSALAGQGTEELLGPDASETLDALSEFLALASDRIAEGQTSAPQDRAPEQGVPADPAGNLSVSADQWRKMPEQPGDHMAISAHRRDILIRYFDRPVEN